MVNFQQELFYQKGIDATKIDELQKVFALWGSIYGLIVLADNKEQYIEHDMKCSKEEFLQQGFERLYQSIVNELTN